MINDSSKAVIREYLKLTPEERDGFHEGVELLKGLGWVGTSKKRGRPKKKDPPATGVTPQRDLGIADAKAGA